jgi:nucleoid DNA-binding protein
MAKKKATAKKTTVKAKAAPKAKTTATTTSVALKSVSKARTKSEIMTAIADNTGMSRKEIGAIFSALGEVIGLDVGKKGPGMFTVPGLMKITRIQKPATKARKGINPFTGQEQMFKAKPARNVVKVRALKALKEMV